MKNGEAKEQLILLYGCRCMLTNIKGKKGLTYHHLWKKVNGGKSTVENGFTGRPEPVGSVWVWNDTVSGKG